MKWQVTIEYKPDKFMTHGEKEVNVMTNSKTVEFYIKEVLAHKVTHDAVRRVEIEVLED